MVDLKETFLERVKAYGCKNEDLAVNYFTRADFELPRLKTPKKWEQLDFDDFVLNSITHANMGVDPFARKTLYFIPRGNRLCIDLRYECLEYMAKTFGINSPLNVTTEIIYSNDKFSLIKKDLANPKDGYLFQVPNPLERGSICGGVYLKEYDNERFDKAVFMSLEAINKRTPNTGTFFANHPEKMCLKTLLKEAWGSVTLDTTRLGEYAKSVVPIKEFEPENMEDLPFIPNAEL